MHPSPTKQRSIDAPSSIVVSAPHIKSLATTPLPTKAFVPIVPLLSEDTPCSVQPLLVRILVIVLQSVIVVHLPMEPL